VSDDGAGIAAADLAALEARLARSRTARTTSSAAKRAGLAFERGFFGGFLGPA